MHSVGVLGGLNPHSKMLHYLEGSVVPVTWSFCPPLQSITAFDGSEEAEHARHRKQLQQSRRQGSPSKDGKMPAARVQHWFIVRYSGGTWGWRVEGVQPCRALETEGDWQAVESHLNSPWRELHQRFSNLHCIRITCIKKCIYLGPCPGPLSPSLQFGVRAFVYLISSPDDSNTHQSLETTALEG